MAFLRIRHRGKRRYFYIVENRRRGGTVRQKTLEFLGHEPGQKRIARALEYWGIRKPKKMAVTKPRKRMLTVHPLGAVSIPALEGRVRFMALSDCPPCQVAVRGFPRHCLQCRAAVEADLLAEHGYRWGRPFCVKCFTPVVDDYEAVRRGLYTGPSLSLFPDGKEWKDVPIPRWVKRSPKEMGMGAQWPESGDAWKQWHADGLAFVLMSGRMPPWLFTERLTRDGNRVLQAMKVPDDLPWATRLAGYLLAGVGGEYLLKSLYLKAGYSLRNPTRPGKQTLAKRDTPEARWFNPYRSASFETLLRDHNLALLSDDWRRYLPMGLTMWWRNEPGHAPVAGSADWGGGYLALGASLRLIHDQLLKDADDAHVKAIQSVLAETKQIHFGAAPAGG
jgi:hypothetical protein